MNDEDSRSGNWVLVFNDGREMAYQERTWRLTKKIDELARQDGLPSDGLPGLLTDGHSRVSATMKRQEKLKKIHKVVMS